MLKPGMLWNAGRMRSGKDAARVGTAWVDAARVGTGRWHR